MNPQLKAGLMHSNAHTLICFVAIAIGAFCQLACGV
jgi:hypothetical protein